MRDRVGGGGEEEEAGVCVGGREKRDRERDSKKHPNYLYWLRTSFANAHFKITDFSVPIIIHRLGNLSLWNNFYIWPKNVLHLK